MRKETYWHPYHLLLLLVVVVVMMVVSNSPSFSYLCLPSPGIKGVHYHHQTLIPFLTPLPPPKQKQDSVR